MSARSSTPATRRRPVPMSIETPRSRWRWVSGGAWFLLIMLVIARFTTVEMLRNPWDITPGAGPTPRGAGPATGMVLDILCLLPALAVLMRSCFDPSYRLLRHWSSVWMFAFGLWALASVAWSADKFAATVEASHLFASLCVLWAASQLVREWAQLRIVAAVGFGLLLVLVAQSVLYRTIDVQADVRYWEQNKTQILQEHNWAPDSFEARQFERKLTSGELFAFFTSPNSFAAIGVTLLFVSLGIGLQKLADGESAGWIALPAVAAGSAVWILVEARSKTSAATPVLGVALLVALWRWQDSIRRRPRQWFCGGAVAAAAGVAAVIGHGLYHHGLFPGHFSNSLDFRWKYWVASARLTARHPLLGVGWDNFGLYYLGVRLPEASEAIKDPHNLLVRCFAELGIVGGMLAIVWLLRLVWEWMPGAGGSGAGDGEAERTNVERAASDSSSQPALHAVAAIAVGGIVLGVLANVDFTQGVADVSLELMRRLLYGLVLVLGAVAGAMRSPQSRSVDDRPAPWIFRGIIVALLLLFVHNLIDFSVFENGIMPLAALLAGAALGARAPASPRYWPRSVAAALLVGALVYLPAAGDVLTRVAGAEQWAFEGDESVRTAPLDLPLGVRDHWHQAAVDYDAAWQAFPWNADYALRAARADVGAGDDADAEAMLAMAQRENPMLIDANLLEANLQLTRPQPDAATVCRDFDQILQRNPHEMSLHQQYADALERLGRWHAAGDQIDAALACNDALPAGEPRRLTPQQVESLQQRARQDRQR